MKMEKYFFQNCIKIFCVSALTASLASCAGKKISTEDEKLREMISPHSEIMERFEVKEGGQENSLDERIGEEATPAEVVMKTVVKPSPEQKKEDLLDPPLQEEKQQEEKKFTYPHRRPQVDPYWVGETHTFELSYMGVVGGVVTTEVKSFKEVNHRKVYHLSGHAKSARVFSLFYKVDDKLETFWDYEGLFSHRFEMNQNQSKFQMRQIELFDSEKEETVFWSRRDREGSIRERTETKEMPPFSQDSFSALYYLRVQDLNDGDVIRFPVVSEGKTFMGVAKVLGRERLNTPLGRRTPTVKLKIETRYNGVIQQNGDSFIWLTDDDRRFIVRLEAEVKIGSLRIRLTELDRGIPPL
jgi:hypothetical protein